MKAPGGGLRVHDCDCGGVQGGSAYFLPRLRGALGYYLGLTGTRLSGRDVLVRL